MKRWKKITLSVLVIVLLVAAVFVVPTVWGKPWSIEHFYARVFVKFTLDHPQLLTSLRIFEPLGLDFNNNDLDDFSIDSAFRNMETSENSLKTLRGYDRATLRDPLSYDVLEWFLSNNVEGRPWMFHGYPVSQQFGFQSNMPDFMINTHQIDDEKGALNFLERLAAFDTAFDQMIVSLKHRENMGVIPPRFVIAYVLREMQEFITPAPEEHVLYVHFEQRVAALDELDDAARSQLLGQAAQVIESDVYPAYHRLIEYFTLLDATASTDDGVWKLPDGNEYYAYRLRSYTTTDMTAEEIHAIGLREVERIISEMKTILVTENLPADDLGATMKTLNEDPRFLYPDTDQGRQQVLDDYGTILDEMERNLDEFFFLQPRAEVVVKRVPEFKEETAPMAYYDAPPMDGSRPGIFYANLADVKEIPKFGMRTLAYHEAIPGHHFQIALAREMQGVPFFRRVIPFTAYTEGWALYAEQLAAENGFQDDPYDRLGYLVAQAMRAVRLVVDTGIHHQRWTREQAIEYMLANTGMPEGEVISEVERYIVDPGQATAYMVGYLELMRLRQEAKAALGESFDIRDFHRVVLSDGALPLTLLRRQVEAWYSGV